MQDLLNKTFNRLTVVEYLYKKSGHWYLLCKCACGNTKKVRNDSLITGNTLSCGCLYNEGNNKKHGLIKHPLHRVWNGMKQRCNNPNDSNYDRYGARGIAVCAEWQNSFEDFYNWCIANGWTKGLQIDRKNNNGNYEPSNCRCVTAKINSCNKRNNINITYKGETKALQQWCDHLNINRGTMIDRLYVNNWSVDKAFTTPVRPIKRAYAQQ